MKKNVFAAVLVAALPTLVLAAQQPASPSMRYVMRMELKETAPADTATPNPMMKAAGDMIRKTMLPDGAVEMELVTDGQATRTEMRGTLANMPKGSVVLYPAGEAKGYVINPQDKTYFVLVPPQMPQLPAGMTMPKPEITIKPSGAFDTIVGHRAEKVNITWRMPIPVPEGVELPPGVPTEITMDMENWCASDLKLPSSAMKMIGGLSQSMPGFGLEEISKACPFALRGRMRMSMLPGYDMLTSVTAAEPITPAPDLFKVPEGYKEVPAPTPKLPGM